MHQSFFEYTITKPYPFRWFTPVVILGGCVLVAVATVLTVATSGYQLQTYSTTNPNATASKQYWFTKAPLSWSGNSRPTCQAQQLPIGSVLFTSNLGLTYELTSVTKVNGVNQSMESLASLPYLNQVLTDCKVVDVQMWFRKADASADTGVWWSWDDGYAVSRANCTVLTTEGSFVAGFSTTFNPVKHDFSFVIQNNIHTNTSMWWATRLLSAYYSSTQVALAFMPTNNPDIEPNPYWTRGSMTFTTNHTADIQSYDLFALDYFFLASDAGIQNEVDYPLTMMYNNPDNTLSEVLTQGLSFARTMYSAILVDLGQPNSSNLLLSPSLLQWAVTHPDDIFRNDPGNKLNCTDPVCWYEYVRYNTFAGPDNTDNSFPSDSNDTSLHHERINMLDAYNKLKPTSSGPGSLGTKPTTIFTQYQCSVPVLKDVGSLFLIVVVAMLVYLQTAWTLLTTVTKLVVERLDPVGARTCAGGKTSSYHHALDESSEIRLNDAYLWKKGNHRSDIHQRSLSRGSDDDGTPMVDNVMGTQNLSAAGAGAGGRYDAHLSYPAPYNDHGFGNHVYERM